jgi:hypothetical protein
MMLMLMLMLITVIKLRWQKDNKDRVAKLPMIVLWMPTVDSEEASADELLFEGNVYKCTQFKLYVYKCIQIFKHIQKYSNSKLKILLILGGSEWQNSLQNCSRNYHFVAWAREFFFLNPSLVFSSDKIAICVCSLQAAHK